MGDECPASTPPRRNCVHVEEAVDTSGMVGFLEELLPKSGRPRELSVRTFLVGMLLAPSAGLAPQIEKARWALTELDEGTKRRLGVIRPDGTHITYKMLADMNDRIVRIFDTSPHFHGDGLTDEEKRWRDDLLETLTARGLGGTIPEEGRPAGSASGR